MIKSIAISCGFIAASTVLIAGCCCFICYLLVVDIGKTGG